jgi:hypothetical protein
MGKTLSLHLTCFCVIGMLTENLFQSIQAELVVPFFEELAASIEQFHERAAPHDSAVDNF